MTTAAERLKASNRGAQLAAPASASRIAALESSGLRFSYLDDITVVVESDYVLNIAGSHWHRIDDPACHGYLVGSLAAEIRKRNSEKPATGRDSVVAGGRTALTATDVTAPIAESVAGPTSSLLPVVAP